MSNRIILIATVLGISLALAGCRQDPPPPPPDTVRAPATIGEDELPAGAYPEIVMLDGLESALVKTQVTVIPSDGKDTLLVRVPVRSVIDGPLRIKWQIIFSTDDGQQVSENPVWHEEVILPRTKKVLEARALTRKATRWNMTIRAAG
jgi:hypothetical protein